MRRLVLACTSAGGTAGASFPLHELETLPARERARRKVEVLDTRNSEPTAAAIDGAMDFAAREDTRVAATPGGKVGTTLQMAARARHDASAGLPGLRCRTLVVSGEYDGIAPAEPAGRQLAGLIPDAEFRTFGAAAPSGGGHLLVKLSSSYNDAPWQAIVDFLLADGDAGDSAEAWTRRTRRTSGILDNYRRQREEERRRHFEAEVAAAKEKAPP